MDSTQRPTARQIAAALLALLNPPPAPKSAPLPPSPSSGPSPGAVLGGFALFTAAMVGLAALAQGEKTWDTSVRRYRGPDGRFK